MPLQPFYNTLDCNSKKKNAYNEKKSIIFMWNEISFIYSSSCQIWRKTRIELWACSVLINYKMVPSHVKSRRYPHHKKSSQIEKKN